MSIPAKMSIVLALAVGLAATFQAGWEFRGDESASSNDGTSRASLVSWGKRMVGVSWLTGIGGLAALFAARRTVAWPLRAMVDAARARRKREGSPPSVPSKRNELAELALEIEGLHAGLEGTRQQLESDADVLAASLERLRHWDRLSTLGRVAATMAHELGTPLNVIDGRATMLLSGDLSPSDVDKNARIIAQQAAKMTKILRDLVEFARRRPLASTTIDLVSLVRAAVGFAQRIARSSAVAISLEEPGIPCEVCGDKDKLLQVMMNLLRNGVQATPHGGVLAVKLSTASRPPRDDPEGPAQDYARVEIVDTGGGFAEDVRSQIFRPFFTTKGAEDGAGLGLSVAQSIAKDHGGWVEARSEPGRGACFTLLLPKGNGHVE